MLHHLLLNKHPLPPPHPVGIRTSDIGFIRFFAKVFEFFFGGGDPEGVFVEHFEADREESREAVSMEGVCEGVEG